MYFKFDCSNCGKSLKVREDQAGRKARCPYCHALVPIPAAAAEQHANDAPATPDLAGSSGAPDKPDTLHIDPRAIPTARTRRRGDHRPHATNAGAVTAADASAATNVSLIVTALIGAGFAAAFYLILLPFRTTYLGVLFYERGWVQFVLTMLLGWSAAILLLKLRKLRRQRESMLFDLLPAEIAPQITSDTVPDFIGHIHALPAEPRRSFLINRVLRGLEHFRIRKSHGEVAGLLASQSEIDATAVDSSYTFVKVCIWAIPILGFIGTVQGISDAVAGFSGSLDAARDVDVLKTSLNDITSGLAVAFDTTLVALVMSLIVMFPMSSLQKSEEDLLNWVDEYCNENLLKRLEEKRGESEADTGRPRKAAWESDDVVKAAVHAAIAGEQGQMIHLVQSLAAKVAQLQTRQVDEYDRAMTGLTERAEQTQHDMAKSLMESSSRLQKYFESLERSIASLNVALHYLGERQVVQAPRRSWWPFGKRNGGHAASSSEAGSSGGSGGRDG